MGCGSSSLKKENLQLKENLSSIGKEKDNVIDMLKEEKKLLRHKLEVLEEMATAAHLCAEKNAVESEERKKQVEALKWELIRQTSPVVSPRSKARWKVREDSAVRVRSPVHKGSKHRNQEEKEEEEEKKEEATCTDRVTSSFSSVASIQERRNSVDSVATSIGSVPET